MKMGSVCQQFMDVRSIERGEFLGIYYHGLFAFSPSFIKTRAKVLALGAVARPSKFGVNYVVLALYYSRVFNRKIGRSLHGSRLLYTYSGV